MDKKTPSKFKGWSNMFFSNYAQGPIKVSPNVLVWSDSPAVQNFNKLRIMHCHQDSKMMLSYVSESVHFDIVDNYCYYCRLTLFSDNICCCCYHHPRCIVWQLARAIRCKFCFWQPIFCAPLFHVIKLTETKNAMYTQTNTKKTIHVVDISVFFVNRSTFPCHKSQIAQSHIIS